MAAIMLQTIPSFYTNVSENSFFISANAYEKKTLFEKTTVSPITTIRRVFYPFVNIIYYYMETFKSYWWTWTHFASPINTWTVCIHYSSIDSAKKFLQRVNKCLITCNKQLTLIPKQGSWQNSEHCKKRPLRRRFKKHLFSSFQKTKTTQTSGSVFAERIEKVKKIKFELEFLKIVGCFLDGHGNYGSISVSFRMKTLKQTRFFVTVN